MNVIDFEKVEHGKYYLVDGQLCRGIRVYDTLGKEKTNAAGVSLWFPSEWRGLQVVNEIRGPIDVGGQ